MNSPVALNLDKQAFLQWAEAREGHFELKGNRIVMMTGGTRNHARITSRILGVLLRQIDLLQWSATAADFAVAIGEDVRYPDILVEPFANTEKSLATETPVVVCEVLSPSSLALDLHVKAAEYMSLPSLEAYLVAAQDEMRMWLWQRPPAGAAQRNFPASPQEFFGPDAKIGLTVLGARIELAEVYAHIVAAP